MKRNILMTLSMLLAVLLFCLSCIKEKQPAIVMPSTAKKLEVEKIIVNSDRDGDGIKDMDDIIEGARKEIKARPLYRDAYYSGGYPPPDEGVCTDVIWRSLKNAGYSLKDMMDKDIASNTGSYPRVAGNPEPNIDFRRVPNHVSFFKRHATSLTTDIKPWDAENLKHWQGGDIVVFGPPCEHIAIISDQRRPDGVPYIIHNAGPYPGEEDMLMSWPSKIIYHFRYPKIQQ